MWYPVIRRALFALDSERAHRLALEALRVTGRRGTSIRSTAPTDLMGLRFSNRVGLAAGFDKSAVAVDGLGALGFGFIEVGTVTPRPQSGQPRPRLFRLPTSGALLNRLGFPNDGAEVVAARLRRRKFRGILGINIGKNADTSISRAVDDYVNCLRLVRGVADYVVVNVSSPNTSALRELQARERLEPLLSALLDERTQGGTKIGRRLPLLVKIAPDLTSGEIGELATLIKAMPLDGVVNQHDSKPSGHSGCRHAAVRRSQRYSPASRGHANRQGVKSVPWQRLPDHRCGRDRLAGISDGYANRRGRSRTAIHRTHLLRPVVDRAMRSSAGGCKRLSRAEHRYLRAHPVAQTHRMFPINYAL